MKHSINDSNLKLIYQHNNNNINDEYLINNENVLIVNILANKKTSICKNIIFLLCVV